MGIKQLYNDSLRKLPNEYGDVSVMWLKIPEDTFSCDEARMVDKNEGPAIFRSCYFAYAFLYSWADRQSGCLRDAFPL